MANHEIVVPKEQDYHGHPGYGKIYIYLLVMLGISLVIGYMTSYYVALFLIFLTAIIKSALVVGNFMHLKYEPKLIWLVVGVVIFILISFFWGVYPDIPMVSLEIAK